MKKAVKKQDFFFSPFGKRNLWGDNPGVSVLFEIFK